MIIDIPLYSIIPKSNSFPQLPKMPKHLKPNRKKKYRESFPREPRESFPHFLFFGCKMILLSPNQVHQLSAHAHAHALPPTAPTAPNQHIVPLNLFSSSEIIP